jgi:hypothetical protein
MLMINNSINKDILDLTQNKWHTDFTFVYTYAISNNLPIIAI